jgi:hypothetical protein
MVDIIIHHCPSICDERDDKPDALRGEHTTAVVVEDLQVREQGRSQIRERRGAGCVRSADLQSDNVLATEIHGSTGFHLTRHVGDQAREFGLADGRLGLSCHMNDVATIFAGRHRELCEQAIL